MIIDWHTLNREPSLPGLYVRAATRRKITGTTLPDTGLRCWLDVDPNAWRRIARSVVLLTTACCHQPIRTSSRLPCRCNCSRRRNFRFRCWG